MKKWGKVLGTCCWILLAIPMQAEGQGEVDLTWQPSAQAKWYEIHWGTTGSRSYEASKNVGNSTAYNLTGMADCTEHWIAARAHNDRGGSGFSNEVACWPRPRLANPECTDGTPPTCTKWKLTEGANFRQGAVVVLTDSSGNQPAWLSILRTEVSDCKTMTFELDLDLSGQCHEACKLDLRVRNPSQVTSRPLEGAIVIQEPPPTPGGARIN
jgi:hypothetical protein